jgi:hypothetical protein
VRPIRWAVAPTTCRPLHHDRYQAGASRLRGSVSPNSDSHAPRGEAARAADCGGRRSAEPVPSDRVSAAGQNLYDLIRAKNLALYPDAELRKHALNAVAIETPRGWRLAKERNSQKIDGVVALSFACLDAIRRRPHDYGSRPTLTADLGRRQTFSVGVLDKAF